jgi:hypothetical protein
MPPIGYTGHSTFRAAAIALLALVALETTVRVAAPWLSGNVEHLRQIDRHLAEFDAASGRRFVFMGNSLTNYAVTPDRFAKRMGAISEHQVTTLKLVPDATTLWDWRCLIDRLPRARPGDVLVLGYAWAQVADQQQLNVGRTFGLVCPLKSIPSAARHRDFAIGEWLEAGLAKLSLTYVLRERISSAMLTHIVPNYEAELQRINDQQRESGSIARDDVERRTYGMLIDSIERVHSLG